MTHYQPLHALPAPLRAFWWTYVAATLLCALVMATTRLLLHLPNPFRSPFFPEHAEQKFLDFYDFSRRFTHFHQLDFFSLAHSRGSIFSYPPPAGLLYAFFYLPPTHRYLFFTAVTVALLATLVLLMARALRRRGLPRKTIALFLPPLALLSYPFWFNFQLGNIEICIFLLLAFAILALLRDRPYLAAALIGIAGSIKLFPLILFALLLSKKHFRPLLFGLAVAAATFLFAVWMECPSFPIARAGMAQGAAVMGAGLILKWLPLENGFDHSLFSLYKTLAPGTLFSPTTLRVYMLLAAITGTLLYFLRIRRLPFLNQLLCLCVAAILLPPMSHHYTLLHLYIPWALLTLFAMDQNRTNTHTPGLLPAMVLLALLLAPQAEFILHHATLSGPLKALELAVLGITALRFPFPPPPAATPPTIQRAPNLPITYAGQNSHLGTPACPLTLPPPALSELRPFGKI